MNRHILAGLGLVAAATILAGCAASPSGSQSTAAPAPSAMMPLPPSAIGNAPSMPEATMPPAPVYAPSPCHTCTIDNVTAPVH
jgi:hypothetical protein